MDEIQIYIPKNSITEVIRLYIPEDTPKDSDLELTIKIESKNLTVREFSNYLSLTDRFYGRIYSDGIFAYSHRENEHLKISEIRDGCIEIIIKETIDRKRISNKLVILFLLLNNLSNISKSSAEAVKKAKSNIYPEENLESRKNRKTLRETLKKDEHLQNMEPYRLDQVVKYFDYLYACEIKRLYCAIETAKNKIKSINLRIKKNK